MTKTEENLEGAGGQSIEQVQTETLVPYARNSRTHSDEQVAQIMASIREFGFCNPVLIDAAGTIIAGHGRVMAATRMKLETVPCLRLSHLTEAQRRAYVIADNRIALSSSWDSELLANELSDLHADEFDMALLGFDADELAALLDFEQLPGDENTGEVVEDEVPEPPVDPITKPGDLWILGSHRLLCGDSTKAADVSRLMAGDTINIAFTSPPYASQRKYDESSGFKPIKPDDFVKWFEPIAANVKSHLAADGSWFVNIKEHCEDGQRSLYVKDLAIAHVRQWAWMLVDEFVWKRGGVPGKWSNRFKNQWEPIFHFSVNPQIKLRHEHVMHASDGAFEYSPDNPKSKTGFFSNKGRDDIAKQGMALPGNVLEIGTEVKMTEVHSAPFPVGLPSFFIKAFTDESDTVYEPFCGSGTTLIAAEQLNRRCFGMEISPGYCDVIVNRWEKLTGKVATREATSQPSAPASSVPPSGNGERLHE
jgi:DNA modification methylase